mgnify:CR=1 FL=1
MLCPLEEIHIGLDKCPVVCLYNHEGLCKYTVIKDLQEKAHDLPDLKSRAAIFSNVIPIQDAIRAANRIKAFVYTDRYAQYAIGKSLNELCMDDFDPLRSETRFNKWPYAKPGFYKIIERVLSMVEERTQPQGT